ncbi:MAG: glycosyltransferase [Candidatus Omnitrophica bacterium]|nr:glycosyltransferase [Candidatus Omnitrophota bacterium]HOX54694.1 glycosyltransferase [Candidatus Omnitrophota bacterium]
MKNLDGKVSILLPAYNEAYHLKDNIEETIRTFDEFGCDYEIVVIDDGSSDNTFEIASEIAKNKSQVIVKRNLSNFGKGRAIKKGFRYISGKYAIFLDADMELHPRQLQNFFDIMRANDADVVIGSKMHPDSKIIYPWHRKIVSRVYFFLIKILFGLPIHDTQTGLKLFKAEVLEKVLPKILVKEFAYDLEVLVNARHLGYRIVEAPVVVHSQKRYGRIGIRSIYKTWIDTLAIFYRLNILKYYDQPPKE